MPNEFADFLLDVGIAQNALYKAAQEDGDHSGESARKLRLLVKACRDALGALDSTSHAAITNRRRARKILKDAVAVVSDEAPISNDIDVLNEAQDRR